ncbi:MAG TPA: hypothetical protein VMW27_31160 [Thermoanaerobaculia bacterium]|nr:hypothetical protein [Thermoanaerobaculia bacterium]
MSSHNTFWRRLWTIYVVTSMVLIAVDVVYLNWREHSLEPLSVPVDLSRPGRYMFSASGFHDSLYHPEFSLELPFRTDFANWFPSQDYIELWAGTPPLIEIEVTDRAGNVLFHDTSKLTRAEGWTVTGTDDVTWIELYKFEEFRGRMFDSYRARLAVLRGSDQAATYRPMFKIAAVKAYALLLPVLSFIALVAVVLVTGIAFAIAHWVPHRRWETALQAASMTGNRQEVPPA